MSEVNVHWANSPRVSVKEEGLEVSVSYSAFRILWRPPLRGLTNIRYPHDLQDLPVDPASDQAKCPQRRHLYLISSGSIVDSQWVHFGRSVSLQGLLSVRLHWRHLWRISFSALFAIKPADQRSLLQSVVELSSPTGFKTDLDKVLKNLSTILGVIHFWMKLEAETVTCIVLHCLDCAIIT